MIFSCQNKPERTGTDGAAGEESAPVALRPQKPLPLRIRQILMIALQCTWGLPQTLIGFWVFLICRMRGRSSFLMETAVCTEWGRNDGISLGLFFFCPKNGGIHLHEYGHTFQSLMLGPLYLAAVSLPSLLWAGLPVFERRRRVKKIPYSRLYCESWADRLGSRYLYRPGRPLERAPREKDNNTPI